LIDSFQSEYIRTWITIKNILKSYLCKIDYKVDDAVEILCGTSEYYDICLDDWVKNATDYSVIFKYIAKYNSIYDYSMLQMFIEVVKCKDAEQVLQEFETKFEESLLNKMDLMELIKNEGRMPSVELRVKYNGLSLNEKEKKMIKKIVCNTFNLPEHSIFFHHAEDGCIALIFEISRSVKDYLLSLKICAGSLVQCSKLCILQFIIGDRKLNVPTDFDDINEVLVYVLG